MKAFAFLLALAFASHFADVDSRMTLAQITNGLKTVRKSCMAKTGVSKEVVAATQNGEFAEDRALMCFYNCAMKMMQMLKDGKYDFDTSVRQGETMLPADLVEKARAMTIICTKKVTSDDACEGSWQYVKCNWETDREVYFFP